MKSITEEMRFRQRLCEYALKHGVTKAARRYHTNRQFVYRQLEKYDGSVRSLALRSRTVSYTHLLDLCVACGHCLAVCQEQIGVSGNTWDVPGAEAEVNCIGCGQCSAACPEQAITLRSEIDMVRPVSYTHLGGCRGFRPNRRACRGRVLRGLHRDT